MRRKKILLALTTVLGLFIALGILEVACRVWHKRKGIETWMYLQALERLNDPDPEVYWVNRPGLTLHATPLNGQQEIITDERGFRVVSRDAVANRPVRADFRALCLGGSTTFGYTIAHGRETYPAQLERLLAEAWPTVSISVWNAGVNRLTSRDSLLRLNRLIPDLEPTDVVIYHNVNDVAALFTPGFRDDYSHRPAPAFRVPVFGERLWCRSHLVQTLRGRVKRPRSRAQQTFQPLKSVARLEIPALEHGAAVFRNNILACRDLCLRHHIRLYVCTFGYDEVMLAESDFQGDKIKALEMYNRVIRELRDEPGVRIVETAAALMDESGVFSDGCHFTPRGTAILAETIKTAILEQVNQQALKEATRGRE